eukprot:6212727-Pleurochrysis_carterae.AAC.2
MAHYICSGWEEDYFETEFMRDLTLRAAATRHLHGARARLRSNACANNAITVVRNLTAARRARSAVVSTVADSPPDTPLALSTSCATRPARRLSSYVLPRGGARTN